MHENAGNLGYRIDFYKYLIDNLNVNILSMAYRGYSYSDAVSPTEEGLKIDADAILKFLSDPANSPHPKMAQHIHRELIFLQGRSLGGAVAIYMANKNPGLFRGLIIENTFSSISDIVDTLFPYVSMFK